MTGLLVGLGFIAVTSASRREVRAARRRMAEQAALLRLATLLAKGAAPDVVMGRCADEIRGVVGTGAVLLRLDADGAATVVGHAGDQPDGVAVGNRLELDPRSPVVEVLRTRRPSRRAGSVAVPIVVGRKIWGALDVGTRSDRFQQPVEEWLESLAELIAISIVNEENWIDLAASRARLVASTHETRQRMEEELQSGPKQGLVSVVLQLRMIQDSVPDDSPQLRNRIGGAADELCAALDELRSITRQLHPPILEVGGLAAAVATLARRSTVPVDLHIEIDRRFPLPVEVATYHLVAEAITNTAKHALATRLHVSLQERDEVLAIAVRDDGVGGADPQVGSGLIGMRDLVEALGGTMEVVSPPDAGTEVLITLPGDLLRPRRVATNSTDATPPPGIRSLASNDAGTPPPTTAGRHYRRSPPAS
jgi:signal transduction histidine kinase